MKLLIAEDDLTSRTILESVTRKWGYEPVAVEDGEAAWQALQDDEPPQLLLLDWEMPKLDGLALCQKIRQHDMSNPPFIILLTARGDTHDIVTGLDSGANEYIVKPFDNTELKARLQAGKRMVELQNSLSQAMSQLQLTASVFSHASEGITITDTEGTIIEVNDAFSRITGYSRDEVIGQNPRILKSGRHGDEFYATMWRELLDKGHWNGEIWNRHKSGEIFAEMLTINAVRNVSNNALHYVALFTDITAQKSMRSDLNISLIMMR